MARMSDEQKKAGAIGGKRANVVRTSDLKDGDVIVFRILPEKNGEGFIRRFGKFFGMPNNSTGRSFLFDPFSTYNKKSDFSHHVYTLSKSEDPDEKAAGEKYRSRTGVRVRAVRRKDLDENGAKAKPFILEMSGAQWQDIFDDLNEQDPTHPLEGFDIKIRRTGTGRTGTKYKCTALADAASPLLPTKEERRALIAVAHELDLEDGFEDDSAVLEEEIFPALFPEAAGNGGKSKKRKSDDDDDDDAPKSKKRKSDDDDDEPATKSKSKKAADDDDDDADDDEPKSKKRKSDDDDDDDADDDDAPAPKKRKAADDDDDDDDDADDDEPAPKKRKAADDDDDDDDDDADDDDAPAPKKRKAADDDDADGDDDDDDDDAPAPKKRKAADDDDADGDDDDDDDDDAPKSKKRKADSDDDDDDAPKSKNRKADSDDDDDDDDAPRKPTRRK